MSSSSNNPLISHQLPISLDVNPDEKGFQSTLILYLRRIANAVNSKESGQFLIQELASFEQWFMPFVADTPTQTRNGYRLTIDLVDLNGGNIPAGATSLVLTAITQPIAITGYLYPVQGFGGAVDTGGLSYFLNDPDIYVRYQASTNTIVIQNNSGNALTWMVWVMEYLKN